MVLMWVKKGCTLEFAVCSVLFLSFDFFFCVGGLVIVWELEGCEHHLPYNPLLLSEYSIWEYE